MESEMCELWCPISAGTIGTICGESDEKEAKNHDPEMNPR